MQDTKPLGVEWLIAVSLTVSSCLFRLTRRNGTL